MKRFLRSTVFAGLTLCVFGMSFPTYAQVCKPKDTTVEQKQAAVKYLRRLSLDLRGRLPSYAEQLKAYQDGHVTDATIDTMLKSGAFLTQMREFFKDLLTLSITDLRIVVGGRSARYERVNNAGQYVGGNVTHTVILDHGNRTVSVFNRGAVIGCLPNEKARYNTNGQLLCKVTSVTGSTPAGVTKGKYVPCIQVYNDNRAGKKYVAQEGYVTVVPYWSQDRKAS